MPARSLPRSILPPALLILLVVMVFSPTMRNQFVDWDDRGEIFQNPDFNPVTPGGLLWNWTHTRLTLYMPVTYMAWGAVAAVARRDADGMLAASAFHGLNLLLHALCTLLVYLLILQLWRRRWPAFLAALVFGVHPIQVEAIAWASGMYTLLSTALCLGALLAYVAFANRAKQVADVKRSTPGLQQSVEESASTSMSNVERPKSKIRGFFLLATALYATALLTKAASVSLPLAAAVIDLLILRRPLAKVARPILIWILLGIPVVLLAKHFQDVSTIPAPPMWGRPIVALDAIGFYLQKILLPMRFIPDYGRNPNWVMRHLPVAILSSLTALGALLCAWFARRGAEWITASVGLLIAGISPYLGLTTFDFQYVSTVADRYVYFGMIGVALLVAGAVIRSRLAGFVVLVAVVAGSVESFRQIQRWHDTRSLFDYTLETNSNSLVSHNVLGFLAAHSNPPDFSTAERHYLAALRIWPEDAAIHFDLANLYAPKNPEIAGRHYELAVRYDPRMAIYHNGLAAVLARTGHAEDAANQWRQAIAIDPDYLDAHRNLADLLLNAGRIDAARQEYHAVLRIDPKNARVISTLKELER